MEGNLWKRLYLSNGLKWVREGMSYFEIWGKGILGIGNSQCKGPVVELLGWLQNTN